MALTSNPTFVTVGTGSQLTLSGAISGAIGLSKAGVVPGALGK